MKSNNVRKAGISLVALVITIIVLIVLTGAVVMTGVNAPSNAQLAVFKNNVIAVQDAVTMKMLNNVLEYIDLNSENAKWIGVAEGYAEADVANAPTFGEEINGVTVVKLDSSLKTSLAISEEEFGKYYVTEEGTVYHEGYTYNGVTYYNVSVINKAVMSISITSMPTKTEYVQGETIDVTGLEVKVTYSDGSTANVTSGITITPEVAETVGTSEITVSYGGVVASEKIEITVNAATTLGSLVTDGSMYGTTVIGYEAGGVTDWSVFYEDTKNGYVYIIASNVLTEEQIPTITGSTKGTQSSYGYGILYWSSAPDIQTMSSNSLFMAEWSDYSANTNGKCVSAILNTENWQAFATPSDTTIEGYVVSAIGSPTAEMFVASWSGKNSSTPMSIIDTSSSGTVSTNGYYYNYNGSIALNHSGLTTTGNELYFPKNNGDTARYWLASPSAANPSHLCFVHSNGSVSGNTLSITSNGLRPVVCLKSDIPAQVSGTGIEI